MVAKFHNKKALQTN